MSDQNSNGNRPDAGGSILRASGVTKAFGSGRTRVEAVRGVSLEVHSGEVILVMGPSGSGKSTLLLILGALLRPTAGSIVLDGVELSALRESSLPAVRLRSVGFIFQDFNLLSALTARQNVEVVLKLAGAQSAKARGRARELLGALGLDARLDFLPSQLSGGEKQRVAIARALANDPRLILADEPTANLDGARGREVMGLLKSIASEEDRALVVVTHDQRLVEHADQVLWLEDGRLAELPAHLQEVLVAG
jgi:putative ABC transport system ATP-binding protein